MDSGRLTVHLFRCACSIGLMAVSANASSPAAPLAEGRGANANVVIILTDDQGLGDVGFQGNARIRTPHLDRFAERGVELAQFYCSPVCAPTRASLMTGRYYYRTGVIHTSRGGAKMHGDERTLAELLAAAGYATGIFGKWHLGDCYPLRPQDQGFAEVLIHKSGGIGQAPDRPNSYFDARLWQGGQQVQPRGYCTDVFTDAALDFIEKNRQRPFFVYLSTNAPHTPLEVDERYVQHYRALGLDDTTAKVYGMVENIDDNVGRLLERLDQLELRDNTLVIFLTDNGPQQPRYTGGLRGRKSWVYEGGIRVPCVVQWPAALVGGRRIESLAAHLDILPTVLEACDVEPPADLQLDGISLLPQLRGGSGGQTFERRLFFQCHRGLQPERYHNCAVVTQRYKLVGNPGTFGQETLPADREPVLELYDLQQDAGEQHDLAALQPEIAGRLRSAYDEWFDDVRSTRGFSPGVIRLGSDAENPVQLCRYQDGTFVEGASRGWAVEIVRGGDYEMRVETGAERRAGQIHVSWQGTTTSRPADARYAARFELPAGSGNLDIWFQAEGQPRVRPGDNSTLGDVLVRRVQ